MNRAFYFLSQGATTSGDTSSTYLPGGMTGIDNQKAGQIWYRALTVYMTPSTNYAAARIALIQATRDLYGASGPEEIAVWNAFAAINGDGPWAGPDAAPTVAVSESGTAGTITFSATASDDKGVAKVDSCSTAWWSAPGPRRRTRCPTTPRSRTTARTPWWRAPPTASACSRTRR